MSELLRVENLAKHYPSASGHDPIRALDGVSFGVDKGQTLGVVGESGCGKSTLARTILRLIEPTAGSVFFEGDDLCKLTARQMRKRRQALQIIFQDPFASLDPRMNVETIVSEGMAIHNIGDRAFRRQRVRELLDVVGLPKRSASAFPHEFSGGQRQRIGIARALAIEPKLIIADEPVSALDVSIQAQILNLLVDLRAEFGLSYVFIAHDLAVVEHISDIVAVMYLGRIVEYAPCEALFARPSHPYTQALMASIPQPDPEQLQSFQPLEGELPNPQNPPSGCPFHPRCPKVMEHCASVVPPNFTVNDRGDHAVTCLLYEGRGVQEKATN